MALKNNLFILLIILFEISQVEAKIQLPELMGKQSTNNLRFITQDGKFTYYQKRSGSLFISSNYKILELIKGQPDSQYSMVAGEAQKKILISQNENFHNFFSTRTPENIYIADYGSNVVTNIGKGVTPKLHLQDTWASFFNPSEKLITFIHTSNSALKFSIRLNNNINAFFNPEIVMADENTVYYTDLGERGIPGIVEYKRNTSKTDVIYKSPAILSKIELAFCNSTLFLAQSGINNNNVGSSLSKIQFPFKDLNTKDTFYSSKLNDPGHIDCSISSNTIHFIKNDGTNLTPSYDIAEYNFNNKKLNMLTDFGSATTLINMDGTLITFDHGIYYIVKGKSDFKTIDSLKTKSEQSTKDESDDE